MHQHYEDILMRIPEPPLWFDDAGVPRFDAFKPSDLANIYAREAALVGIECQACGTAFRVALTGGFADAGHSLSDMVWLRRLHGRMVTANATTALALLLFMLGERASDAKLRERYAAARSVVVDRVRLPNRFVQA